MSQQDIRWKQRFANYKKALSTLEKGIEQYHKTGLSELKKQGFIQGLNLHLKCRGRRVKEHSII